MPFAVYLLAAGTFVMGTSEFIIAGLLPEMADSFDVSIPRAGLAITVFAVGIIVGSPTTALITLRLPRRITLVIALTVFALGHVVVALSTNFTLMLGARFITAMVTGAFWAIASVTASRIAGPEKSSAAIAMVLGGGLLANAVGVPVGSFAGQHIGWRGPFWALAGIALIAAVAVARFVPADKPNTGSPPTIRAEIATLRSGRLWLALGTCIGVTGGVLAVYSYISPLLTERTGLPESAVPAVLVAFGVAAFVGSILGGRIGEKRPYASGMVAAGVSVLCCAGLFFFASSAIPTVALFTLLGLSGFIANPIIFVLVLRYSGANATLSSALAPSMFNVGTAIGSAIAGATLSTGLTELGPPLVGLVGSAIIFIPLGTLAILSRRDRSTAPRPDAVSAPQ